MAPRARLASFFWYRFIVVNLSFFVVGFDIIISYIYRMLRWAHVSCVARLGPDWLGWRALPRLGAPEAAGQTHLGAQENITKNHILSQECQELGVCFGMTS